MLRTEPSTPEQLRVVEDLEEMVTTWTPVVHINNTSVDLIVEPKFIDTIKQILQSKKIKYITAIPDLQVEDANYFTSCSSVTNYNF